MKTKKRTHNCGELRSSHIDKNVTLVGWVNRRRDHGGLIFIDLRDRYGLTQLVFDPTTDKNAHKIADSLRSEWVIQVHGKVIPRAEGMANKKMATGDIEVEADTLTILSKAKTPPFSIADEISEVSEELRLRYRYLDIRRGELLSNLALRSKAMNAIRSFLLDQEFLEVTTPILGKSTPEGARDYLVPSRVHQGSFYALPQSPQLFKQLLMMSGLERYFQIAQCFRDEDLRADRQPEFTQVDLEMSFGEAEDIYALMEGMLKKLFKECRGVDIETPFRRVPYAECIEKYGTDRPDLRFGMELHRIDDIALKSDFSVLQSVIDQGGVVKAICVKGGAELSRREIDNYTDFVKQFGLQGLAWMKYQEDSFSSNIVKFFSEELLAELKKQMGISEGDLVLIAGANESVVNQSLDHLRRQIARDRGLISSDQLEFLWVTEFPLFEWDEDENRVTSIHHPFTAPHEDDIELLKENPLKVRSVSYDVVLNGYELGGGSQRIHSSEIQKQVFEALKLSEEEINSKFGFFADALQYGTPPHLGIALGLDRLMMLLIGTENIRDVIAFPKTQKASDVMMSAPAHVAEKQLDELKIAVEKQPFILENN